MNSGKKMRITLYLLYAMIIFLAGSGFPTFLPPAGALAAEDLVTQGRGVFEANCARCHRLQGEGVADKFPALNKNPFVVGDSAPVIATVLNGRKGEMGKMPAWKGKLSDSQIAAAITYIRQAWSNKAPGVTPATVAALRGK